MKKLVKTEETPAAELRYNLFFLVNWILETNTSCSSAQHLLHMLSAEGADQQISLISHVTLCLVVVRVGGNVN